MDLKKIIRIFDIDDSNICYFAEYRSSVFHRWYRDFVVVEYSVEFVEEDVVDSLFLARRQVVDLVQYPFPFFV